MIQTIRVINDEGVVTELEVWICDACESCVSFVLTRDDILCCSCRAPQPNYFSGRAKGLH